MCIYCLELSGNIGTMAGEGALEIKRIGYGCYEGRKWKHGVKLTGKRGGQTGPGEWRKE